VRGNGVFWDKNLAPEEKGGEGKSQERYGGGEDTLNGKFWEKTAEKKEGFALAS